MKLAITHCAARPIVVGIRRVIATIPPDPWGRRRANDPAGTQHWETTFDPADMALGNAEFIPASTPDEGLERLQARFPSPDPALTRVRAKEREARYVPSRYEQGRYIAGKTINPTPGAYDYAVFPRPHLTRAARNKLDEEALVRLADRHGPILVARDDVDEIRELSAESDLGLTIRPCIDTAFALLRYDPVRSRAAVKAAETRRARVEAETRRKNSVDRLETEIARLAGAILRRVGDEGYRAVLDSEGLSADSVLPAARLCDRVLGRHAYRRLAAWASFRRLLAEAAKVGIALDELDLVASVRAWVEAELKARKPRERKPKPEPAAEESVSLAG